MGPINIYGTGYFQATAKSKQALILGSLRQFVFLMPLVFILPKFMGLTGVWMATPVADFLGVVVTLILLIPSLKSLGK